MLCVYTLVLLGPTQIISQLIQAMNSNLVFYKAPHRDHRDFSNGDVFSPCELIELYHMRMSIHLGMSKGLVPQVLLNAYTRTGGVDYTAMVLSRPCDDCKSAKKKFQENNVRQHSLT